MFTLLLEMLITTDELLATVGRTTGRHSNGNSRRHSVMKSTLAIVWRMDLVVDGDEERSKNLAQAATVSCSAYAPADGQKACSRIG